MAGRSARPGRVLIVFLLGVAILYGLVAIGGNWKPALGLDLQGGTRITLIAEGDPDKESMDEAQKIIDQRVNGKGVSEAEVTVQGDRFIVVEIPGKNRSDLVDTVSRTAQLRFRTVACSSVAPGPCGTATAPETNDPLAPDATQQPTEQPSEQPSESPSSKPSEKASDKPSPKNRPAYGLVADKKKNDEKGDKPASKPSQSPSASPSESPTASPSETPAPSDSPTAAPVDANDRAGQALKFMAAPDQASIDAYNAYTCPSTEPVVDDPAKPLVTCGVDEEAGVKYLLSPAAIEGTELTDATAGVPAGQVAWQVNLSIGGEGKDVFKELSQNMVNTDQQFAVVLDGQVISSPGFSGVITNGDAQISGGFNEASATSLATSLKFGALPVDFQDDPTTEDVGPSLAGDQLQAGLTAAVLGLVLVMLYCLVYYRGLGLVVLLSLLVAAAVTYAMVLLLANTAGFTLTLPGIAGLIIGVGVTADSFIIFFERIRDEMREGKSMRVAVETGWKRARKTRLAANVVSLLSAAVLYLFATGVVKGFGFALGLSTLIDLAILFWFTKPLVSTLARFKFFNGGGELSGLSASTLGIDHVPAGGKA
ncbi:protein translocase subunit SecD [Nocardioides sp. SR21]|uniref:protein translocase subunit SecD n=1 Tax=Nocardioides sp. SR21 TaxID=2919501 RepID=UPI001FA980A3|nr:protein translocase subunit SecD [Nocardioides sp. SR21]